MRYIDVQWIHENSQDPIRLVSELESERNEVRKLEFFRYGTVGIASSSRTSAGTRLGETPVPALEEINSDPQFHGVEIERHEFEELWNKHANNNA